MELQCLIEELTDSKNTDLDDTKIHELKALCKLSNENINRAFHITWTRLKERDSRTRLLAIQVLDVLFCRSAAFRDLLLFHVQEFAKLSLGVGPKYSLPPPKSFAKKLKHSSTCIFKKWHDKYGNAYKSLQLTYKFLKNCKGIKFDDREFEMEAEEMSEKEKMEIERTTRLNVAGEQFKTLEAEMMTYITEIKIYLDLLVPKPSEFQVFSVDENEIDDKKCDNNDDDSDSYEMVSGDENEGSSSFPLRLHGLTSQRIHLVLNFEENNLISIKKSDDNADILSSMNEKIVVLAEKCVPSLKEILDVFEKYGSTSKDYDDAVSLKTDANFILEKARKIDVRDEDESDYDDFIEVPQLCQANESVPSNLQDNGTFVLENYFPGNSKSIARKKKTKNAPKKNDTRNRRIHKILMKSKH